MLAKNERDVSGDEEMDEELVDKTTGKKASFKLPVAFGSKVAGHSSGLGIEISHGSKGKSPGEPTYVKMASSTYRNIESFRDWGAGLNMLAAAGTVASHPSPPIASIPSM